MLNFKKTIFFVPIFSLIIQCGLEGKKALEQEMNSNLTDEKILYEQVKKIPSKYLEKNRDGYKKLMDMNPSNQTYKKKYFHYKKLYEREKNTSNNDISKNKKNAYDKEIVTSSPIKAEKSKNNLFAETIKKMEISGAFTKDPAKSSIYVETSFWNAMSSHQKEGFCYMLQKTYPMYAQSILDKYSGRKLAETNIYGELAVIQ